jgi:hypothetical protein
LYTDLFSKDSEGGLWTELVATFLLIYHSYPHQHQQNKFQKHHHQKLSQKYPLQKRSQKHH